MTREAALAVGDAAHQSVRESATLMALYIGEIAHASASSHSE